MSAHQAEHMVATMCRVLDVSRSGFYAWRQRQPSMQARSDGALKEQIVAIHEASRATLWCAKGPFSSSRGWTSTSAGSAWLG